MLNAMGGLIRGMMIGARWIDKAAFRAFRPSYPRQTMNGERPVYSTAATRPQERAGLSARVDNVASAPGLDAPADRPFAFSYTVTVCNQTTGPVTIRGRKWVLKDIATGRCHVVEVDGVAGRFPRLEPGECFRYDSFHVIAADSLAEGALLACDDTGQPVLVRFAPFVMRVTA